MVRNGRFSCEPTFYFYSIRTILTGHWDRRYPTLLGWWMQGLHLLLFLQLQTLKIINAHIFRSVLSLTVRLFLWPNLECRTFFRINVPRFLGSLISSRSKMGFFGGKGGKN